MEAKALAKKHLELLRKILVEIPYDEKWKDLRREIQSLADELEEEIEIASNLQPSSDSDKMISLLSLAASIISIFLGFS